MKHKVGDKVRIKSIDWYNSYKKCGSVIHRYSFTKGMSKFCGKKATIIKLNSESYDIDIDNNNYFWTDEMFEENFNSMETNKIILPKGWEIDKVENGEIILKESKKELPKTWEECYIKLGMGEYISNLSEIIENIDLFKSYKSNKNMLPVGLGKPMLALCQLLVCREVYRNGWKPDWKSSSDKYIIENFHNKLHKECYSNIARILSFQSEEVRDAFLENFRDLIEEAKELI